MLLNWHYTARTHPLPQPEDTGRGHYGRTLGLSARSATRDVERTDKLITRCDCCALEVCTGRNSTARPGRAGLTGRPARADL